MLIAGNFACFKAIRQKNKKLGHSCYQMSLTVLVLKSMFGFLIVMKVDGRLKYLQVYLFGHVSSFCWTIAFGQGLRAHILGY